MLSKQKSKAVYQLKYVLLLPLVLGMLVYSSCERELEKETPTNLGADFETELLDEMVIVGYDDALEMKVGDLNNLTAEEKAGQEALLAKVLVEKASVVIRMEDDGGNIVTIETKKGIVHSVNVHKEGGLDTSTSGLDAKGMAVPFATIDEAPIFPGCEGAADKKACFQEKIMTHVKKHFNYPQEAQDLGIQGRVSVVFTIDESGNITNIKKRGPHELLEKEVERIINRLPQMQAGKHDGKMVKVPFSIPITFKL